MNIQLHENNTKRCQCLEQDVSKWSSADLSSEILGQEYEGEFLLAEPQMI